ncbi:amine oxidase, flavin-containing superfamily [Lophiostoma macrostomum CBS 122681]|uniref:Amine oxidase, flavin-containing superfamily n=1 Tax=Lophiostoma macrostomum CBS 122681 TaxID=1314788 RepID=A0A6A6TAB3_9PLEO|nr:amine oxidase, flavin-containing superfamily [Lophiostoma macrostomum CBS 122681]
MPSNLLSTLSLLGILVAQSCGSPSHPSAFDRSHFSEADTITRDVAIIGGGSGGTYSAICLKDKGKSVLVIEKKGRLGGHTETYIDPATGIPIDIGVQIWHNVSVVTDYFKRFDIPLIVSGSDSNPNITISQGNYDFRTGQPVNVTSPSAAEVSAAFAAYAAQLEKYPELNNGMFLPNPVPEDLVLPFGKFVKKYHLEAAVRTMYQYNPGLGDILTGPTVEQMRVFGLSLVSQLSTGFLTTAHHNNSELYTKATAELLSTSSLLLNSTVTHSIRPSSNSSHSSPTNTTHPIQLLVSTPSGQKLILAKKLLITIPTRPELLTPFSLSPHESHIFSKLINAGYYTSILRTTGIPSTLSLSAAAPSTPYNIPALPGLYGIQPAPVPGLHIAYYGTPLSPSLYTASDAEVRANIIAGIKRVQAANPSVFNATEPEFVVYSSHAPFYLQARARDTQEGFYAEMYALQGERRTWWTGASWRAQDSSDIWRYTAGVVLPGVLEGL